MAKGRTRAVAGRFMLAAIALLATHTAQSRGWTRAESAHFVVYSNVSAKVTRET